jgi:hypothetical protein
MVRSKMRRKISYNIHMSGSRGSHDEDERESRREKGNHILKEHSRSGGRREWIIWEDRGSGLNRRML